MSANETRVGFGSVCAGVVVSLAIAAMFVALGAAIAGSSFGLDPDAIVLHRNTVIIWLAAALMVGAFFGGRSAAVSSRLLLRSDGALAGLVTWSLLVVVLLALGAGWISAAPTLAWRFAPEVEGGLWALFATQLLTLLAAVVGGIVGSRAEARSIGLRSVHVSKRGFVTAPEAYESDFFGSSSLSSSNTTSP